MPEKIVQLNEEVIKGQIKELVRGSVEETLNELLEAEAQKLIQAARYERIEQRQGNRSGHLSVHYHQIFCIFLKLFHSLFQIRLQVLAKRKNALWFGWGETYC